MVTLGADLHQRWHTVVAVDGTGRKLDERTMSATPEGHLELRRWAERWPDWIWASRTAGTCRADSRRSSCGPGKRSCASR